MRIKFFKIGLPIMVFMMAIVFAFASASTTKTEDSVLVPTPGYIFHFGKCEQVTICSFDPGPLCMYNGMVARSRINETQCGVQLNVWN